MKREITRQGMHLVFTTALALVSLVFSQLWLILLITGLLVWLVLFLRFRPESKFFLRAMERAHDKQRFPGKGAILLLLGALLTAVLFPAHVFPALLVLGIADSLSTLAGMRFGKKRIGTTKKTWVGSGTFFVCSATILFFFSSWWALIALLVTALELINFHRFLLLDDNLIIPLCVAVALSIL